MTETEYQAGMKLAESRAHIGPGVHNVSRIIESLRNVQGDIVECGSYKAGNAIAMAVSADYFRSTERTSRYWDGLPAKIVYAFDSFEGMPEVTEHDKHKKGDFGDLAYEEVTRASEAFANLKLIRGEFRYTVPVFRDRNLSLLFLDCDLYESYKICLEHFFPRIVKGGLLICEDYQQPYCPGATKAIQEFFSKDDLERCKKYEDYWGIEKL